MKDTTIITSAKEHTCFFCKKSFIPSEEAPYCSLCGEDTWFYTVKILHLKTMLMKKEFIKTYLKTIDTTMKNIGWSSRLRRRFSSGLKRTLTMDLTPNGSRDSDATLEEGLYECLTELERLDAKKFTETK